MVMEHLEKACRYFQDWKLNPKSFGKVMKMCCITFFIYAEFEIIKNKKFALQVNAP